MRKKLFKKKLHETMFIHKVSLDKVFNEHDKEVAESKQK